MDPFDPADFVGRGGAEHFQPERADLALGSVHPGARAWEKLLALGRVYYRWIESGAVAAELIESLLSIDAAELELLADPAEILAWVAAARLAGPPARQSFKKIRPRRLRAKAPRCKS